MNNIKKYSKQCDLIKQSDLIQQSELSKQNYLHNQNDLTDQNNLENNSSENNSSENNSSENNSSENNSSENNSLSDDDIINHDDNLKLEGCVLDKYNILCELGRGMYSIVWLAYCIENSKYYAIKVQNPNEYKEGINENNFVKKLPNLDVFNKLITYFVEIKNNKKYLCTVYNLYCCNLDYLLRKGNYKNGFSFNQSKKILIQLLEACNYLHDNLKVYHADIKTDNILLKGINNKNQYIINIYDKLNFNELYSKAKKQHFILNKKLSSSTKLKFRSKIHSELYNKITNILNNNDIKNNIDDKYIENSNVSLSDFGQFVEEGEYYNESFGTRYYRSPENILIGKSKFSNDIWALGCTFYEILTGDILFDPQKNKTFSRDDFHLKLINESCGDFSLSFLKSTKLWKIHFKQNGKLKIDINLDYTNKIENKLRSILTDDNEYNLSIKIIKGMLKINPNERLKSNDIIKLLKEY